MAEKTQLEQFEARNGEAISSSYIIPGLALGESLGIFNLMVKLGEPKTSQEIADAGNFKERYIREWLALMVTSKIIDYDDSSKTYYLQPERLPVLNGKLPIFQLASTDGFRFVRECFPKDGPPGTKYSNYPLFEEHMDKWTTSIFNEGNLKDIFNKVPGLLEKLEKGIEVHEFGCGNGHLSLLAAKLFSNSKFYGSDIAETAITDANKKAKQRGLANVQFDVVDLYEIPADWQNRSDFIFVHGVIHDLGKPQEALASINKVLKPGGHFLMLDIAAHSSLEQNRAVAKAPAYYFASLLYCMPFSLGSCENGAGLGACWGKELANEMLQKAGFKIVKVELDFKDGLMAFVGTK